MSIELTVEDAMAYLCAASRGNFYAYLMNTLERVYTHSIPTFCVAPKGRTYVMMINPDFAGKQPFERLVAIIEHEVLHIVLMHAPRTMTLFQLCQTDADRRYFFLAKPLAVDAAVNEFVRQNHKWIAIAPPIKTREDEYYACRFILPEDYDLPNGGSFDGYTATLMSRFRKMLPDPDKVIQEVVSQLKDQIEAGGGVQPGSILGAVVPKLLRDSGESDETSKESEAEEFSDLEARLIKDLVKSIGEHLSEYLEDITDPAKSKHLEAHGKEVVRTASKTYSKTRGTLPAGLQVLIAQLLTPPTVPWTELFAAYVQNAQKSRPIRGMRRVSKRRAALQILLKNSAIPVRRMPLFPGTERDVKFVVWVTVDTSGSMSNDEIGLALAEVQHIQRSAQDMEVHVLYVDAGVGKHYQIGPTDKLDYDVVGRGGTDFETAFAYVAEHATHIDLMVYITDGFAPRPKTKLPCQTIWLLTPNGKSNMHDQPGHTVLQMRDHSVGETL